MNWDNLFGSTIKHVLEEHQNKLLKFLKSFNQLQADVFKESGVENDRISRNFSHQFEDQSKTIESLLVTVRDTIQEEQKDVSRVITPQIQTALTPGSPHHFVLD